MNISTIFKDFEPETRKRLRDAARQRLIRSGFAYDKDAELSDAELAIVNETIAANAAETLEIADKEKNRIEELERTRISLTAKVRDLKIENEDYKQRIEAAEIAEKQAVNALKAAMQEIEDTNYLKTDAEKRVRDRADEIEELKKIIYSEREAHKSYRDKANKENEETADNLDKLLKQIEELEDTKKRLLDTIEKLKFVNTKAAERILTWKAKTDAAIEELKHIKSRFQFKIKDKIAELYSTFDSFNFVNIITNIFAFFGFFHIFDAIGIVMLLICGAAYFGAIRELKNHHSNSTLAMSFVMIIILEVVYYFVHQVYFLWLLIQYATVETATQNSVSFWFAILMSGIGFYAVLMTYLKRLDAELF